MDAGYRARNPGQQWTTVFDGRGFTTTPDEGDWTWGLELLRCGFAGSEQQMTSPVRVHVDGGRVAYDWDDRLTEWYVNDARGLEHGYTVHARPAGPTGELTLDLAIRGELDTAVSADGRDGRDVRFVGAAGSTVLTYSGLTVFDADGHPLAARFEPTSIGLRLTVDDQDARYPLTIDPIAQQAYLKASNTGADDWFGSSVAVSGDTVVVGAKEEASNATGVNGEQGDNSAEDAGATYVFHIEQAECFLVIGDSPGDAPFFDMGHLFETQLDAVEDSYAVLMEDIPYFVLPGPGPWAVGAGGVSGDGGWSGPSAGPSNVPEWMWDGEFTLQILLWNPSVFPALPEQSSRGLYVRLLPDGGVVTRSYGTGTGIEVWAETDVNADGQPVVRFPFSIPGL